jgi:hypothetical protein
VNLPSSFVTAVRVAPVCENVSVTFAPGITPPFGSVTVPDIVPVIDCASIENALRIITEMLTNNLKPFNLKLDIEEDLLRS